MTDYRAIYEAGCCKPNHGCNVATTCMCGLAEDLIEENERLRAALNAVADANKIMEARAIAQRALINDQHH